MAYTPRPTPKPAPKGGSVAKSAGSAAKAPRMGISTKGAAAPKVKAAGSKAIKTVTRTVLKSGGTRGEARGVVANLRHGTNLSPKAQVQRTKSIARSEGLSKARIQKTAQAEKTIARRAAKRQAARTPQTGEKKSPRRGYKPTGK